MNMSEKGGTAAKTIVLATRNQGKIKEFRELLLPFGLEVLGLDAFPHVKDVEETGTTFADNARLKACAASAATGLVAVADDSGLEVDALGGAPGVYSARYSELSEVPATDERNLAKLLEAMRGVPREKRRARFRCFMVACTPPGDTLSAQGEWEGFLAEAPKGSNGFGYDPIFFDPEKACSAAQMSREEKNSRSHRAKATSALLQEWPFFWAKWVASAVCRGSGQKIG